MRQRKCRTLKKPKYKSPKKKIYEECGKLWSECVKARAGYKSELSGKTERLVSHHIAGKPNYRLRFDLDNGICLTQGEHHWIAHNAGRYEEFRRHVISLRGEHIYHYLQSLGWGVCKTDLSAVRIYLKKKLGYYKRLFVQEAFK